MNSRSFIIMIAVGSALLGASVAIRTHSPTQVSPSLPPSAQLSAESISPPPAIPASTPSSPTLLPYDLNPVINPQVESVRIDELHIVKEQLRRAIEQRNPALLRSLMQAGSLRQVLAALEVPEPVSLDNLDASAWAVLERAITYRCRHFKEPTLPDTGSCFEPPLQKLPQ